MKQDKTTHIKRFNPIAWAFALAILLIFGAIAYRITTNCEPSIYTLFDQLKISLGGCTPVSVNPPVVSQCKAISFAATDYARAKNIGVGTLTYGNVITNGGDGSKDQENMVEFTFKSGGSCNYRLDIEYAAADVRAVVISFNGDILNKNGLSERTGGWGMGSQKVFTQGSLTTVKGLNKLKLYRSSVFPHIKSVRLIPTAN